MSRSFPVAMFQMPWTQFAIQVTSKYEGKEWEMKFTCQIRMNWTVLGDPGEQFWAINNVMDH